MRQRSHHVQVYRVIESYLKRANNEKKALIKIFENLWDKYKTSLEELKGERDQEVRKLEEFLAGLGYYNNVGGFDYGR
jgi:hypothetical protein